LVVIVVNLLIDFGCLEVQKLRNDVVIKTPSTRRGGTLLKI
jgi:hypothetical protein